MKTLMSCLKSMIIFTVLIFFIGCSNNSDYRSSIKLKKDVKILKESTLLALYPNRYPDKSTDFYKSMRTLCLRSYKLKDSDYLAKDKKVIRDTLFVNGDDASIWATKRYFDESGKLLKIDVFTFLNWGYEWELHKSIDIAYDKQGEITNFPEEYFYHYSFDESKSKYDENGNLIEGHITDINYPNNSVYTFTYEFDSKHNWIKKYWFKDSKLMYLTIREINYFSDKEIVIKPKKAEENQSDNSEQKIGEFLISHNFVNYELGGTTYIKFSSQKGGGFGAMTMSMGSCDFIYSYILNGNSIELTFSGSTCNTIGGSQSMSFNSNNTISVYIKGQEFTFKPM